MGWVCTCHLGAVWYVAVRHSQRSVLRRSRRGEVWRGEVVCCGIQLETGIEERNMEHENDENTLTSFITMTIIKAG